MMKKKLFSLALTLVMALSLAVPAMAADINVGNAVNGQTYKAYKLFDVTQSGESYSYSLASTETALKTLLGEAGLTFRPSADGSRYYVTDGLDSAEDAAALAAYLNEHVDSLGDPDGYAVAAEGVANITNLDAGYYFVTTSVGSLCILNTTGAVDIAEKNEEPTVEKKVVTDDTKVGTNSVEIGDTVDYEIVVTIQPGAENYILHDEMSAGLTLKPETIEVAGTENTNYELKTSGITDDCDFEISFHQDYLDTITTATKITITYSATVNANAQVGTDPNTNEAILNYGENNDVTTTPAKTETFTYDFAISKVDSESQPLTGAEFSLYAQETGGDPIALVDNGNGNYRVATDEEIATADATTTTIVVNGGGKATVSGLAGKTYWLEETKAPDGYNMLENRQKVAFDTNDLEDVTITNLAGDVLPATGGMGTTIFYALGGTLVVAAAVLLITKKRMHNVED